MPGKPSVEHKIFQCYSNLFFVVKELIHNLKKGIDNVSYLSYPKQEFEL
jgi:hypothetical protein